MIFDKRELAALEVPVDKRRGFASVKGLERGRMQENDANGGRTETTRLAHVHLITLRHATEVDVSILHL
jgi:hypothetical protein